MMTFVTRAVWLVVLLVAVMTILVGGHEAAHMLMARLLGVKVDAFAIGFGPSLLSWHDGAMEWRLNAVLLGGYVEIPAAELAAAPAYKQLLILAAGPTSNLLMASVIFRGVLHLGNLNLLLGMQGASIERDHPWMSPIGLIRMLELKIERFGWGGFWYTLMMAATAVGMFNFLPIPPLDGGKMVLVLIGMVLPAAPAAAPVVVPVVDAGWSLPDVLALSMLFGFLGWVVWKDIRNWNLPDAYYTGREPLRSARSKSAKQDA